MTKTRMLMTFWAGNDEFAPIIVVILPIFYDFV